MPKVARFVTVVLLGIKPLFTVHFTTTPHKCCTCCNSYTVVVCIHRETQISNCMDCHGRFQAGLAVASSIHFITEQPQ